MSFVHNHPQHLDEKALDYAHIPTMKSRCMAYCSTRSHISYSTQNQVAVPLVET